MLALRVPCASRHDWALRNSLRSNSARAYPITYSDAQLSNKGDRFIFLYFDLAAAGRSFILFAQNKGTKQKDSPCLPYGFPRFSIYLRYDENSLRSDTRRICLK